MSDGALRVLYPYNWLQPPAWRPRLLAIESDLANEGPLSKDLRAVRRDGGFRAEEELERVLPNYADFLPGEAGRAVAWAIVTDSPIHRLRARGHETSDVFDDPLPPFRDFSRTGRNRFAARGIRSERDRVLLELLTRDFGRAPSTHKEVARKLGMTGRQLHQTLHRLSRTHGVRLRSAKEHEVVASILDVDPEAKPRFRLLWERLSGKTEAIPIELVEQRTGLEADKLREAGCQVYTSRFAGGLPIEVMNVPVELVKNAGASDSECETSSRDHPSSTGAGRGKHGCGNGVTRC